jgi:hypothetical protein
MTVSTVTPPTHRPTSPTTDHLTSTTPLTFLSTLTTSRSPLFKIHYCTTHLCITIRWTRDAGKPPHPVLILKQGHGLIRGGV